MGTRCPGRDAAGRAANPAKAGLHRRPEAGEAQRRRRSEPRAAPAHHLPCRHAMPRLPTHSGCSHAAPEDMGPLLRCLRLNTFLLPFGAGGASMRQATCMQRGACVFQCAVLTHPLCWRHHGTVLLSQGQLRSQLCQGLSPQCLLPARRRRHPHRLGHAAGAPTASQVFATVGSAATAGEGGAWGARGLHLLGQTISAD